jgi:hypothetical protein
MPTPQRFSRNIEDKGRLLITAVDGFGGHVRAHFNPKEVQFDKKVNWNEKKAAGHNEPYFEYTSGTPRSMTMELLFDRFEVKDETVEPELQTLQQMTMALDPKSKKESERRPPLLKVTNGPIPNFQCVLESLMIKVTMFDRQGRPVRATATVTFKELRLKGVKVERPNSAPGGGDRVGQNWQKPSDEEVSQSREQGRKDRERIELLQSLE